MDVEVHSRPQVGVWGAMEAFYNTDLVLSRSLFVCLQLLSFLA